MIAKPFSPGNAFPAEEVATGRIQFRQGLHRNGSYDDLLQAALIARAARQAGRERAVTDFVVFPGSIGVKETIENPDPRLGGAVGRRGAALDRRPDPRLVVRSRASGQGPDALGEGQVAITSFNRNWQNRMGRGSMGYLASPSVVTASALLGYMAPPNELGLDWDPEAVRDLTGTFRFDRSILKRDYQRGNVSFPPGNPF